MQPHGQGCNVPAKYIPSILYPCNEEVLNCGLSVLPLDNFISLLIIQAYAELKCLHLSSGFDSIIDYYVGTSRTDYSRTIAHPIKCVQSFIFSYDTVMLCFNSVIRRLAGQLLRSTIIYRYIYILPCSGGTPVDCAVAVVPVPLKLVAVSPPSSSPRNQIQSY